MIEAQQDDADLIERFEERIAIMVIDGETTEREAVRHAYGELRRKYGSGKMPEHVQRRMREVINLGRA